MADIETRNVHIHGIDILIKKIQSVGQGAPRYMFSVLEQALKLDVWPEYIRHISLQDHSLEDLRNLGHPYSKRYPTDYFSAHRDDSVHIQSGDLLESSQIVMGEDAAGVYAQIVNTSPHYLAIRYGTPTMRMRDPGGAALADSFEAVKRRFAFMVRSAIIEYFTRA
jgi:hypothetical protein